MKSEGGQTLLELVVVVAVSVLVVGALVFTVIASLRNAGFAKNQAQATKLAQEGIELVRTGRDRDVSIFSLPASPDCPALDTWNGTGSSGSIWGCKIYNTCGSGGNCYLNVDDTGSNAGALTYITTYTPTPTQELPLGAENIPPFKRAVMISDDQSTFSSQKTVTVIVTWSDFSGEHQSRLTTILRKK